MRRIYMIIITFLFLPYISVNAFNLSLKTTEKNYTNKDIINIKIEGSNIPKYGISSGQFYINYNNNSYSFSCSDIEYKQNINMNEIDCNIIDGKIIIIYIDQEVGNSPLSDGEFFNLPFKVKDKVKTNTKFTLNGEGFAGVINGEIKDYELDSIEGMNLSLKLNNNVLKSNNVILSMILIIILFISIFIIKIIIKEKRRGK